MERATVESPYYNYEKASLYCNLHPTTLWRAVKKGRLKASGYGRAVRFHRRDLDEFMTARSVDRGR